jgi:hypothetical protein
LILRLTFGYSVVDDQYEDPLVNIAEKAMQGFARASEPGAFLVDIIPLLKYVPSWVPGAGFQKEAVRMRSELEKLYDVPYAFVKREMVKPPMNSEKLYLTALHRAPVSPLPLLYLYILRKKWHQRSRKKN